MTTATKEKPILFSGPMVRAILNGSKTQTRRIAKLPLHWSFPPAAFIDGGINRWGHSQSERIECPYGGPGHRLWVKEKHALRDDIDWRVKPEKAAHYAIYDGHGDPHDEHNWHSYSKWRSARFMPRCLCRITLEVTGVRVERVNEISAKDIIAEGFPFNSDRDFFRATWDDLHGKGAFDRGDWVWVIEFKRVDA